MRHHQNSASTGSTASTDSTAADHNKPSIDGSEKDKLLESGHAGSTTNLATGKTQSVGDHSDVPLPLIWDGGHSDNGIEMELWLGPPPYPSLTSSDIAEWELSLDIDNEMSRNLRNGSFNSIYTATTMTESSGFEHFSSQCSNETNQTPQPNNHGTKSIISTPFIGGHDCALGAHEILESLSFHHLSQAQRSRPSLSVTLLAPGLAPGDTACQSISISLDHVLRLNREASERLSPLLNCSCARSPPIALLYASIISRVLIWYQQAAAGSASSTPTGSSQCTSAASSGSFATMNQDMDTDMERHTMLTPVSDSGTKPGTSAGSWTNVETSTVEGSVNGGTSNTTSSVATDMTIGTFNVDDLCVQTALKLQLLSGEMRRVGQLIDQFTSRDHGKSLAFVGADGGSTLGGLDNFYQSLDQWLKGEHSRITYRMKSKLRELNTG